MRASQSVTSLRRVYNSAFSPCRHWIPGFAMFVPDVFLTDTLSERRLLFVACFQLLMKGKNEKILRYR
jgi:hypothetical protein